MVMFMVNIHSSISFALVNIPVVLNPVIKNNDTVFNQLLKKGLQSVKYIRYCLHCKKDNYLIFSKQALDNLKSSRNDEIKVISFIEKSGVPVWYFEKSLKEKK